MSPVGIAALFFTVVLLGITAYFIMGGLPLLILQHDTPVDQRFVRRFFDVCYKAAMIAAVCTAVSYALWGRMFFAAGAAGIAVAVLFLRGQLLPNMEQVGTRIQAGDTAAVVAFRRLHSFALLANLVQLAVLVWGVTRIKL